MSVKKDRFSWFFVIAIVLLVLGIVWAFIVAYGRPHVSLRLGDGVFTAELARTASERQQGLGGVSTLPKNKAMLFVFDRDGYHAVHMRNMKISIDVIWLDKDKKVVHIVRNMSPDTYPRVFEPSEPARYIIEVAAGVANDRNIRVGNTAVFDLNEIKGIDW